MTLPQVWNALAEGKPPDSGRRTFRSTGEARAWREAQQRAVQPR
jgi:hypothetical protein